MIGFLKGFFAFVLVAMLGVTTWASMDRSVFEAGNLLDDPWGVATLFDAYFGFLTFYLWLFYKEPRWLARVVWLLLILSLGNIAMAVYALIKLVRLPPRAGIEDLLLRRTSPNR
jgi:membrane-associated phospholipid phosphatase